MDDPALRNALWPSQIKAPMGQGQFASHRLRTPLLICISSCYFTRFREMSPLSEQFADFLQPEFAEEFNSESPWLAGTISSASHEDTFRSFEGAATPLEGSPVPPTVHLLSWFDDDYLGPSSGDAERVNFADFTLDTWVMPFGTQSDDPYATFSLSLSLSIMMTDRTFILDRVALAIAIRQPTSTCSRTNTELATQYRR